MEKAQETPLTERKVLRRGVIAGLASLVAAAAFKVPGASRTEAANGGSMILGQTNDATLDTRLTSTASIGFSVLKDGANAVNNCAITVGNGNSAAGNRGIFASAVGTANQAIDGRNHDSGGMGLQGVGSGVTGIGVRGIGENSAAGIRGVSNSSTGVSEAANGSGNGVEGKTGSGVGVLGEATSSNASSALGVSGVAGGNGTGIRGVSNSGGNLSALGNGSGTGVHGMSGSGPGVKGQSSNGPGVQGVSDNQPGIDGTSTNSLGIRGTSTNFVGIVGISTNNHGLYGSTHGANAFGIVAENTGGGPGLLVTGNAQIFGSLQVFGVKNAVIKMADGSNAAVYCQESPEPYFEDFGRAQIVGGVANVPLEREFATLVAGGDYMVFPVAEGETRGLFVSRRNAGGFEVREMQGGTGNVPFTYRIVTRRKDVDAKRFARVSTQAADNIAGVRAVLSSMSTPGAYSTTTPQPGGPAPGYTVSPGLTVQKPATP